MKRINKTDSRIYRTAYGWFAVLFSIPFIAIGTYFALAGFGYLPIPGKVNGPLWVLGTVGLAFAMSGLVLCSHGIRGVMQKRRAAAVGQYGLSSSGEPWLVDYPWDRRGIWDNASGRCIHMLTGFILFAVFMSPFNWWAFLSGEGPLMVKLIVGLFDAITIGIFVAFIYRLLQYAKFGSSYLEFLNFPFFPGGKLKVALSPHRFEEMDVTLRFVEERFETHGSGKNRSQTLVTYEHYSEKVKLQEPMTFDKLGIEFDIPENPDWVNRLSADPGVRYWELVVEASVPGIDFRTTFPVPVYKRP
ncbi:MAG: hypothetical protein V3W31_09020 [Thermodesulfobacteriota bacterium]